MLIPRDWRTAASCALHRCMMGSSSSHISGVMGTRPITTEECCMDPRLGLFEGRCRHSQRRSRHYTGTSQCGAARARGVVENLFSTASGPVSTVLRSRSGAAFCCWLGPWFHTTLLCCNGPCPHDPPRCRLHSIPSHTEGTAPPLIGDFEL